MKEENTPSLRPLTAYVSGKTFTFSMLFVMVAFLLFGIVTAILEKNGDGYKTNAAYILFSYIPISVAIFLGSLIGLKSEGVSLKENLSIKTDKIFVLVIALVFLGSFFGLFEINNWISKLFEKLGHTPSAGTLPEKNFFNVLATVFFVAVIPASVEEILFRGIILKGLKSRGMIKSVLISAFLFSLYHMSPDKTVYQFVIGLVYGLIAFCSGSVLPTFILHFLNNFIVIVNWYFLGFQLTPSNGAIYYISMILGILAVVLGVFISLKYFKKEEKLKKKVKESEKTGLDENGLKVFFIASAPGIIAGLFVWIVSFFS